MICSEIKKYDNERFWSEYISDWEGYDNKYSCPFARLKGTHNNEDKNKSFVVYSNGTFKCFCASCNEQGDMINFYAAYHGIDNKSAIKELARLYVKPVTLRNDISAMYVEAYKKLKKNEAVMEKLKNDRCISLNTINRFKIGYHNERLITPVLIDGHLVNINKHDIMKTLRKDGQQSSLWELGAEITPFPYSSLKNDHIVLCAGIPDTLAMISELEGTRYSPMTFGGESALPAKYQNAFKNKIVYILFDNDNAGKAGTLLIAKKLKGVKEIKRISLCTDDNDITDYLVKINKQDRKERILKLIENSEHIDIKEEKIRDHVKDIEFDKLDDISTFGKKSNVDITIIGVSSHPFICPVAITAECTMSNCKECQSCKLGASDGKIERVLSEEEIIQFVDINKTRREKLIKDIIVINKKCPGYVNIEIEDGTVFEVSLSEKIGSNTTNKDYKTGFVVNYKPKINDIYKAHVTPVVMPKSQQLTYMINNMQPQENILETFELSKGDIEKLSSLYIDKLSVKEKVEFLSDELSKFIVKRWGREDNITAANLSIFSCCEFKFNNSENRLCRGWVEVLMIGDSGTAKSDTVEALFGHYKLGHVVVGEHVTPAGLIGSLMSLGTGSKCFIWGAIPSNDRRIIFIDEVHGKDPTETLKSLTSIRSSGIANKTVQGGTRQTTARCRMIFAANSSKKMGTSSTPIEYVKEVFTSQEDRARLDLVICLSNRETTLEQLHTISRTTRECEFSSHICNALVTWVWSRKPDQIVISDIDYIMKKSKEMIGIYGDSDIEIVHESRYATKLARLSIAVAAMCFSSDLHNKNIIVMNEHVDYAIEFQKKIYNKDICGYDKYANKIAFTTLPKPEEHRKEFMDMIKDNSYCNVDYIDEYIAENIFDNKVQADEFIKLGRRNGYFKKYLNGFKPTKKYKEALKLSQKESQ